MPSREVITLKIGTVDSERTVPIPGDFEAAVSLLVAVYATPVRPPKARPTGPAEPTPTGCWALQDSISGRGWTSVENTHGVFYLRTGTKKTSGTGRFVVPFGSQLRLSIWTIDSSGRTQPGQLIDVLAEILVTRFS